MQISETVLCLVHPRVADLAAPVGPRKLLTTPTNGGSWLDRGPNLHPGKRWPINCHHLWVWSTTSWDSMGAAKSANQGWVDDQSCLRPLFHSHLWQPFFLPSLGKLIQNSGVYFAIHCAVASLFWWRWRMKIIDEKIYSSLTLNLTTKNLINFSKGVQHAQN